MCYSSHLIKVSFITREVFCYEFFNFCNAFCGTLLVTVHIQVHQYRIKDILKLRLTKQTCNHESKVILCTLLLVHTFAVSCYSILNNNCLGVLHFIFVIISNKLICMSTFTSIVVILHNFSLSFALYFCASCIIIACTYYSLHM